jgi:gas vesicle protein
LNKEEIIKTSGEINSIKIDIKDKNHQIKDQKTKLKLAEKLHSTLSRKSSRATSLLGDVKEEFHEGIRIFDLEDIEEQEEEQELNLENE